MKDSELERIALISIIAGLILMLILMPKYEAVNAHYLTENDNKAYLEGIIQKKTYNQESGWSFLEIRSCKNMNSFYEGTIDKEEGDNIQVQGSYYEGSFSIKKYE